MRTRSLLPAVVLTLLLLVAPSACSESASPDTAAAKPASQQAPKPSGHTEDDGHGHGDARGTPLPAHSGSTLDGAPLSFSSLIGKRFLLFGFNPEVTTAMHAAAALSAIKDERAEHNFEIIGVAAGATAERSKQFLVDHDLEITTLFDGDARINNKLRRQFGLKNAQWLLLVDANGSVINGLTGFPPEAAGLEDSLREMLRLTTGDPIAALAQEKPKAPLFTTQRFDDGADFRLAEHIGKPFVLIFFLHTCPHCHEALRAMQPVLDAMPEAARPALFGISIVNKPSTVLAELKREELDFFPVLGDGDGSIARSYGAARAVPVTYMVDADGRIQARTEGWRADRDGALTRMRLNRLAAQPVPILLHKTGYSGNEFCTVCHENQTVTWELTNHAGAYDTLVRHGADHDGECVSCHVVGYGKPGGFSIATAAALPSLEGVGCETCHGRGGPHLSPNHVTENNYEPICATCHNPEHSLGFEYAKFLPQVSHAANLAIASLPADELAKVLAERRQLRDVIPKEADYVGTPACVSCHAAEHATWSEHPHAKALATLAAEGEAANPDCLKCHTTGYAEATGFPEGGASDHPGLAGVGCESCHGPGGDHIGEDAPKRGTILSLGDKCDSCVILQICGSCHDDANDPGFEFEVEDKIDQQRHGTIEAGTGNPLDAASLPASTVNALLERAFEQAPSLAGAGR